jgi:hypothetical protein
MIDPFSSVAIALLKGIVYLETSPGEWQALLELQARVRDYFAPLGLELQLDEAEGYAFLRQRPVTEGEDELPRLIPRRPLRFPVSLLLALLRKKLAEHDATGGDPRVILSRADLAEQLRLFLPDSENEAKLMDRFDAHLNKVIDLGFARRLKGNGDHFEVRRVLKAFVDAQWLSELDRRLAEYQAALSGDGAIEASHE